MSDFFGDYFAPAALVGGAGLMAYRTGRDALARGTVTRRWNEQKASGEFFSALQASRVNRYEMSPDQVADSLFYNSSRYYGKQGFGKDPGMTNKYVGFARQQALKSMVGTFGLKNKIAAMAGGDLGAMDRSQILSLIQDNPTHKRHLERVAGSLGLLDLVNIQKADGITGEALDRTASGAYQKLQKGYEAFYGSSGTLQKVIEGDEFLHAGLHPGRFADTRAINSPGELGGLMRNSFDFRPDQGRLIEATANLYQDIQRLKDQGIDISMELKTLNRGGEKLTGLRIASNEVVMDLPFVQANGRLHVGYFSQEEKIARRVGNTRIKDFIQTGRGNMSQSLDVGLIDYLRSNLEGFRTGQMNWREFYGGLHGTWNDETGKAIMPVTANKALNLKRAHEVTLRNSPINPSLSDGELEGLFQRLRSMGIDAFSGLSPNQQVSRIAIDPVGTGSMTNDKIHNRIIGTQSHGWSTGDDKTLAQMLRGKVVTSGVRHRGEVLGIGQRVVGDFHHSVRTMAIQKDHLELLLSKSSHAHMGFASGASEDVSILLDRGIRYAENRALRMEGSSLMSTKLTQIMQDPSYQVLRDAFTGEGVSAAIQRYAGMGTEEGAATAKLLDEQRRLGRADLVAELPQGGYMPGGKNGTFMIEKATWLDRTGGPFEDRPGQLTFFGTEEMRLQTGDKIMGMKRIIGGEMSRAEGQFMAALYRSGQAMGIDGGELMVADDFYGQGMAHYQRQAASLAGADMGIGFSHPSMRPDFIDEDVWKQATRGLDDLQMLDSQGLKKIGGRTMDFAVQGMMSEIAYEADLARDQWTKHAFGLSEAMQKTQAYKAAAAEGAHFDISGIVRNWDELETAAPERIMAEQKRLDNLVRQFTASEDAPWLDRKIMTHAAGLAEERQRFAAASESASRAGMRWIDGMWTVDDTMDMRALTDPTDPRNLANRFDNLLVETMVENEHSVVKRWSVERLFKDMGVAEDMTSANRIEQFKYMMTDKGNRASLIKLLQNQLQHGVWNRAISVHGAPQATTASGGPGSFNLPMMSHMRAQGGVMSSLGMEFAGRLGKQKADEAVHVYRRMGAFYNGLEGGTKTVDLDSLAKSWNFDNDAIGDLFGRNQYARDTRFGQLREMFGIEDGDHLLFKSGDTTIYHPQAMSGHTGAYTTPDGRQVMSGVDNALQSLMYAHKAKNEKGITSSLGMYEEELKAISVGRNQAPSKMYSGKLQGSLRGQARPQLSKHFLDYIGADYGTAAGVRESQYRRMLADMGAVGEEFNFDDRIAALRAGNEAAVVARQPGTELYRISAMNLYSIDEAVRNYSTLRGAEQSTEQLMAQVRDISSQTFNNTQKHIANLEAAMDLMEANKIASGRLTAELAKLDEALAGAKGLHRKGKLQTRRNRLASASGGEEYIQRHVGNLTKKPVGQTPAQLHEHWTKGLQSALLGQIGDVPVLLPEHMELILGADYDDDQLDVILAKNKELAGQLQERASFQSQLLRDNVSIAEARGLATTHEQRLAVSDYSYKKLQGQLYQQLKSREPGVIDAGSSHPFMQDGKVNPAWMERKRGQRLMAAMEKGYIGQMTNTVDFTRDVLRATGAETGEARLFAEMTLGVLPEAALKARQAGPQELLDSGLDEAITGIKDILSGNAGADITAQETKILFDRHFKTIYGESDFVNRMLGQSGRVIEAIRSKPGSLPHNTLSKALKRKPEDVDSAAMRRMVGLLEDHGVSSVQSRAYGSAIKGTGILSQNSERARHLKNTASTFSDVYDIMKTHKKPALIGGAIALGTSMILASPDKIGPDAESYAGARRDASRPTQDGPQFAPEAPVVAGGGRSVRIRGRTGAEFDPSAASEILQRQYPGADVSYTMNDYRERINQEYLRKRLER